MLRDGTYNEFVEKNLPYPYRTGVIKRSAVYAAEPDYKEREFEGLKPEQIQSGCRKTLQNCYNVDGFNSVTC